MVPGSTSLQRTYRYLRIAIVGAVVVVFTAIATTLPSVGLLPSISHYYYTPAHTLFVGALIAVSVSISIAMPVLVIVGLVWGFSRAAFLQWAHVAAASVFFLLIAVVAVLAAVAPSAPGAPPWLRRAYVAIAVAIVVIVAGMPLYGPLHAGPVYGVFIGEVLALALFATFWILQSLQHWRSDDPAILAARGG